MQGDEGDLGPGFLQPRDQIGADVDRDHLVAERGERILDPGAASQRHLPLEPPSALEDSDSHRRERDRPVARCRPRSRPVGGWADDVVLTGDRAVELHLGIDHAADPLDPLADLVRARGREVEPHRRSSAAIHVRRGAGDEGDVLAQRLRQQVGGVDVVRQRRPAEQAAGGVRPGRPFGEEPLQRLEHRVAALAVDAAEVVDVAAPVALAEVLANEVLGQGRGAEVGRLLSQHHLLHHRRRRAEPAEPDPGREDLGEGAEVEDVVAAVELVQRLDRLALVAQQAVRVVLDHDQLALAGELDQPPPPLGRHRHPGGVLEAGTV